MRFPVELAIASRVPPGHGLAISVGASEIALFNLGGHVHALEDSCLRCGASLAAGIVIGTCVTCPRCKWQYYIPSGAVVGMPSLRLDRFEVIVGDGGVVIETTPIANSR